MKRVGKVLTLITWGSMLFLLPGCFSYFLPEQGYLSRDGQLLPGGELVIMPKTAPSIANGFKPEGGHNGIDIIAKRGVPVIAAADGVVIGAYFEPFYGNRVEISHGKDKWGRLTKSVYLHLNELNIQEGGTVARGEKIGAMGRTGLMAGGIVHLHFEIRVTNEPGKTVTTPVHPHAYWVDGPGRVTCFEPEKNYPEIPPVKTTYPVLCSQ